MNPTTTDTLFNMQIKECGQRPQDSVCFATSAMDIMQQNVCECGSLMSSALRCRVSI